MKQRFLLPVLLGTLLLSACSLNDLNIEKAWKETEAPENLADVVFAPPGGEKAETRTALDVNTPVTVYVYRRAVATTQDLTVDPYKVVTGTAQGTGTGIANLSTLVFTSGNQTNGKLQVTKGYTYDFVLVTSQNTGTSLTNGVLSGLPIGIDLLAGRAEAVTVDTQPTTTSVTVTCKAGGADSYGNMPRLTARLALNISRANTFITGLGLTSATVKVKSLTLKNINTTASLDFAGSPLTLSNSATAGNYTFTTADGNSRIISSTTSGFGYDPGIYVLSTPAASTLSYDLVLTVDGTDYTLSGSANLPAMTGGNVYTLDSSMDMNMYPIMYDANGGTAALGMQYKNWGTNLPITTTIPTRTGYNFLGWATSITATTAYIAKGASVADANLEKSSFSTAGVTLYAIWGPVAHRGWAGSNIYWDPALGHLTFDDVNVRTHEQYQGIFFQCGSLWGVSSVGTWNGSTTLYSPAATSGTASTYGYSAWGSIPHVPATVLADRNRAYVYEIHNPSQGVGDICRYMTEKGWAPAGKKWRMPTSNEFGALSNYTQIGNTNGTTSTDAAGRFPVTNGFRVTDTSNGVTSTPYIPLSGARDDVITLQTGPQAFYWSSSPNRPNTYILYYDPGYTTVPGTNSAHLTNGYPIRCVVE